MKLKIIDLNSKFDKSKIVTNSESLDKQKGFTEDGIFSEKIFGQLQNENYQYSCKCGKTKGKFYLNHKCLYCETKVIFTESIISKKGWIDLSNKYFFINPLLALFFHKIIGIGNYKKILSYNKKIDVDGNLVSEEDVEDITSEEFEKNPYINIGIIEFKDKWKEICKFFINKTSNSEEKEKYYKFIKKNKDKIFINKFPILPTVLRPVVVLNGSLIFDEINNSYNKIIGISNMIKESERGTSSYNDLEVIPMLFNIQMELEVIFKKLLDNIGGKTGYIRNNIMGKLLLM